MIVFGVCYMSRSRRKKPIIRHGGSDKWWRRNYNRKLRRANKVLLQKQKEDFLPKLVREVSNVWDSSRDCTFRFTYLKDGNLCHLSNVGFWADFYGVSIEEYIEKEKKEAKEEYNKWMRK